LMPTETPSPTEPVQTPDEPATGFAGSPAPLSFVPHTQAEPVRINTKINTGRYGELDAHELIHLLDSIEDERARGRFRESIYISVFVWIVIAWVVLYGPRYLWHAPQLVNPADVLKHREMVELNTPSLPPSARAARPTPKPLDNKTIEHLKATAPKATPPPTPQPLPATPQPTVPPPVATSPVSPRPQPPVAEAPTPQPQPTTRPNFNTNSSPGDAVRNAARDAARSRDSFGGGGGGGGFNRFQGGVQVLSDLQGVDFREYLQRVYNDVKRNWIPLLPEETQPPLLKQGETYVRFSILPDGSIGEMHLDGPSGDVAIDKAAWGSIVSEGQFPPLPAKFHGPKLELRYHYIVNKQIQ
jgi:outer membrane biosynthesis protein TonB